MSRSGHVATVLDDLAASLGLSGIRLDEGDRATLTFDETPVTFAYTAEPIELLWLHVELGEIPADGDEAPLFLLKLARSTWALGQMTIGLDQSGRQILGHTSIPVALLDTDTLRQTLTAVLQLAVPLRARLAEGRYDLPQEELEGPRQSGSEPEYIRV